MRIAQDDPADTDFRELDAFGQRWQRRSFEQRDFSGSALEELVTSGWSIVRPIPRRGAAGV